MKPQSTARFIRRTELVAGEYRRNFHQIDHEIALAVASTDADRVTPLMSKIYLRLLTSPSSFHERPGILRFQEQSTPDGSRQTAWTSLCSLLGVSSATASKALRWLHDQAIIGYDARKNGVGIRIFLNRASSSIGRRAKPEGENFLPSCHTSFPVARTSSNEVPFKDTYGVLEVLDKTEIHAPKNGATDLDQRTFAFFDLVVKRVEREIGSRIQLAANRAAQNEHERTRNWLEKHGIPKAARVAHSEALKILSAKQARPVRDSNMYTKNATDRHDIAESKHLSDEDIRELAEISLTMLELHGQEIATTVAQLLGENCLPADKERVVCVASALLEGSNPVTESA